MQPQHLEAPKQKENLMFIGKFLVKATMLFIRISSLKNAVCGKVGNPISHMTEQPQKGYKKS